MTDIFKVPHKLKWLVWGGDPIPTHVHRNQLLLARRQRGIFNLCVGCENVEGTSVILSPNSSGLCGQPKCKACHRTQKLNL